MIEIIKVQKNSFVFEQGDVADCMYIVKSGQINLHISDGASDKVVDTAGMGQLIGEMALFDKKLRSASARAIVDSELIKLPYKKLEEELSQMPEWVQVTLKTLSEKIRQANNRILSNK